MKRQGNGGSRFIDGRIKHWHRTEAQERCAKGSCFVIPGYLIEAGY
jgi:hypothetical protein